MILYTVLFKDSNAPVAARVLNIETRLDDATTLAEEFLSKMFVNYVMNVEYCVLDQLIADDSSEYIENVVYSSSFSVRNRKTKLESHVAIVVQRFN